MLKQMVSVILLIILVFTLISCGRGGDEKTDSLSSSEEKEVSTLLEDLKTLDQLNEDLGQDIDLYELDNLPLD